MMGNEWVWTQEKVEIVSCVAGDTVGLSTSFIHPSELHLALLTSILLQLCFRTMCTYLKGKI